MTYVIAEPCIGSKDASCLEVCPVDCIHPTPDEPGFADAEMLFIDPHECIDCGVCAEACPVQAPYSDVELPARWERFAEANAGYFGRAP
jgi:NAD-dependent dihydropyrimidine dehydrogenase PreA subunit